MITTMKKLSVFCSFVLAAQMILSLLTLPATAEGDTGVYEVPESPSITYNMNLDWKFFDCRTNDEIWTAMAKADKNGKKFYEKDYDDSDWETVSIPHGIGGGTNSFGALQGDNGGGYRSVLLYRKTITIPDYQPGSKVFFELEGIRQSVYVWVNGQQVGYYEAGITAMGFDITKYIESQSSSASAGKAVIALCNDGWTTKGNANRTPHETVPGAKWGSSYTPDNGTNIVGGGAAYQWNTMDFNEPEIGLVYDAYLHVKSNVYQTLPLYNNLKTTGNYIYANDFNIRENKATIRVDAEVRNESNKADNYTLEVAVVDADGKLKYNFSSQPANVPVATDKGVVYETAVEDDVYDEANVQNPVGITKVNTVDVTHIKANCDAEGLRFWSLEDPYLYTVYTILKDSDGKVVDVQKKETGFRQVEFDKSSGVKINGRGVWLRGYAQRSTNEWAVIGVANDWLNDFDMKLFKENNANFIRWMHVAPKPYEVRSTDRYGIAIAAPAGDKEGDVGGRQWSQRAEAMRDTMIYFRNNPSVIFWETGNSAITAEKAHEMADLRDELDPYGMRFIGARSTGNVPEQLDYEYNYAGTMYGNNGSEANKAMVTNGIFGPIMETEYARPESPRRVWDDYSPPDYDYVNKTLTNGKSKQDGYDAHDLTQEEITVNNVKEYNGYWSNRNGAGTNLFSAEAMMVWSDSIMHTRNAASENCRTSGRVDPIRQTKEMYNGMTAAQSSTPALHIIGHWSYPEYTETSDNYYYYEKASNGTYAEYNTSSRKRRDPTKKTVYVIGSADVSSVKLFRLDGTTETEIGTDNEATDSFVYQFDNVNVTLGDAVIARAYDINGKELKEAEDKIKRTYEANSVKLTAHTAVKTGENGQTVGDWRADGADIAYFDVEVLDKNGNVCALNYDRIDFKAEGEGVYLGGYNSGMGTNCFQNTAASAGLSNYFGGIKDGVSTLGKSYVYAENGTNRIFVRSTRKAGEFKLTATLSGVGSATATITSNEVEMAGENSGLTLETPSVLSPDAQAAPQMSNVAPMKPLMLFTATRKSPLIDWSKVVKIQNVDTNVYFDVYVDGQPVNLSTRVKLGNVDDHTLFGPLAEIMDAVKTAGKTDFSYAYDDTATPIRLDITAPDASVYTYYNGMNQMDKDGQNYSETVEAATLANGALIANVQMMLQIIDVNFNVDTANKKLEITTTSNQGGAE